MKRKTLSQAISMSLLFTMSAGVLPAAALEAEPHETAQVENSEKENQAINLYNPDDPDNLDRTVLQNHQEQHNLNLFTTHKIEVDKGDTLFWGNVPEMGYLGEVYNANNEIIAAITSDTAARLATGYRAVYQGEWPNDEYRYGYTISQDNAAYVRLVGSMPYKRTFNIYKNLEGGLSQFPKTGVDLIEEAEEKNLNGMDYRLYVPQGNEQTKAPVVLFLHGAGLRDTDNLRQLHEGIEPFVRTQPQAKDAIIIAPQCHPDQAWVNFNWHQGNYDSSQIDHADIDKAIAILKDVIETYNVDTDRIYVTGISMGGYGTWRTIIEYPDLFAAAIPFCGAGDESRVQEIKDMPIWAVHGTADNEVPFNATAGMVSALKEAGSSQVRFTPLEGHNHAIQDLGMSIEGLGEWLFSNRKSDRTGTASLFDQTSSDNWTNSRMEKGSRIQDDGTFVTHALPIRPNDSITWNTDDPGRALIEFYDANGKVIARLSGKAITKAGTLCSIDIYPEEAAWTRIQIPKAEADSLMVLRNHEGEWPQEKLAADDYLENRKVLFIGDSMSSAFTDESGKSGWAERIGEAHNMIWNNRSVTSASISTTRGDNRIISQMDDQPYKMVILQGGGNDAIDKVDLGTISEGFDPSSFDSNDTFAGALEELIYTAKEKYPDAAMGFILPYAIENCSYLTDPDQMDPYVEMEKQILDKWDIPYLDLYKGTVHEDGTLKSFSKDILKTQTNEYLAYGDPKEAHLSAAGYDVISPYIANWMSTLRLDQPRADVQAYPEVNTKALEQAIADADEMKDSDYFANSPAQIRANFNALKDKADALVADDLKDHDGVEQMTKDLSAMNSLVQLSGQRELLKALIQEAEAIEKDRYEEDGISNLDEKLNQAKDLLSQDGHDFETLKASHDALKEAKENLVEKSEPVIDRSGLQAIYDQVKDLDLGKYQEQGKEEFARALANAKAVLENTGSTQDEVDSVRTALQTAFKALKPNEAKPPKADFSALNTLFGQVKNIDLTKYEDAGKAAFGNALNQAKAVLENENSTQDQIDSARADLDKAFKALVLKAEKPDPKPGDDNKDPKPGTDNKGDQTDKKDDKTDNNSQSSNNPSGSNKTQTPVKKPSGTNSAKTGITSTAFSLSGLAALTMAVLLKKRKS